MDTDTKNHPTTDRLPEAMTEATAKIAPVWPLESFVAVNPYLGMIDEDFGAVARRLRRVAGARMTMPTVFYLDALSAGRMTEDDVAAALAAAAGSEADVQPFLRDARAAREADAAPSAPTVADVASDLTGDDWVRFVTDRVSAWASSHFDRGQAAWGPASEDHGVYAAWRAEAELDRTPEIMGLPGFRAAVARLPAEPGAAAAAALERLQVPSAGLDAYLHRLLLRVGGWSAYAARIVWDERLYNGAEDDTLRQLLCVLLGWEAAMLDSLQPWGLSEAWAEARAELVEPKEDEALERNLILQAAYERAAMRAWQEKFDGGEPTGAKADQERPKAQAIFCIDVRSEVYRRHLEAADAKIETLGFAGFFAFPIEHVPLAHETGGAQCPVLLTPAARVVETVSDPQLEASAVTKRRLVHEVQRAWKAFKMGAVSCFSFVGPVGLAYLPKLFTDAFGWTRPVPHPSTEGLDEAAAAARATSLEPVEQDGQATGIAPETRVEMAAGALGAMSLTEGFSRLVLLTGHGSTTVNNPHATGLDCGACGGRTGEANARVAAQILNDPQVRRGLAKRGIEVPEDTVFLACQHDTCTDEVTIFNRGDVQSTHKDELAELEATLRRASRTCRAERAARLALQSGQDVDQAVLARSRDWAQVRPEWGLAGCSAFIVAPRHRTAHLSLDGKAFLHSYEWEQDQGFGVLELIMTAPMVVASWISLQYYASTVDNTLFGCGNKTLHNVVGTVGVLEGNAGDLRVGLPWQSVHDGEDLQHDPLKLDVMIEAPIEAMNAIIEKHEMVRQLLDNGWLHLHAIGPDGRLSHVYRGGLRWAPLRGSASPETKEAPALAAVG